MTAVTHPPFGPRRSTVRAATWWGKAWVRAVEESAYGEGELRLGRSLSRSGTLGGITVEPGSIVAAVPDRGEFQSVRILVPVLDQRDLRAFVEVVAAESGRIAALLVGELPHLLVEHTEESGVELLPYGGELDASCTCSAWTQPCPHAVAVLHQFAWLLDADPLVLLLVRGLPREDLLASLHELSLTAPDSANGDSGVENQPEQPDLEAAAEAAARARRVLELLDDPRASVDHLF